MRNQYDQSRSHNAADLRKLNFFRLMMIDIDEIFIHATQSEWRSVGKQSYPNEITQP